MLILKEITSHSSFYPEANQLLHLAFPPEERREDEQQRIVTDTNKMFQALAIISNFDFAGFVNIWHLNGVIYIEHIAIVPELRNQGIASDALRHLMLHNRPIILEVELPHDDESRRRISFYERNGFVLRPTEYTQPPYAQHLPAVKMHLMTYGKIENITDVIDSIRENVYREYRE